MLGNFACFLPSADFKKSIINIIIKVSSSLDPDLTRCFLGPDLGNKLFASWLSDDKVTSSGGRKFK